MASSVVTRRPALNSLTMPCLSRAALICGPPAVHDDGLEAGVVQEHDVLGEGGFQVLVDHGVAAELDDDRLAVVPGEPGQRLDEDLGLGQRGVLAGGAHDEYALFSWT
ncbi:hypothetical protein RKD18_002046 [Streptomyces phaeoluteigriseus]